MDLKKSIECVRLMTERVLKASGCAYAWCEQDGVRAWVVEESAGKSNQKFWLTLSPDKDSIFFNALYLCPEDHASRTALLEFANAVNEEGWGDAMAWVDEDDTLTISRSLDLLPELVEEQNEARLAEHLHKILSLLRRFADVASAVSVGEAWEAAKTRLLEKWEVAKESSQAKHEELETEGTVPHEPVSEEDDYQAALAEIRKTHHASVPHLQRRLGWGYNHAARIIGLLEARGVVGPTII